MNTKLLLKNVCNTLGISDFVHEYICVKQQGWEWIKKYPDGYYVGWCRIHKYFHIVKDVYKLAPKEILLAKLPRPLTSSEQALSSIKLKQETWIIK